MLLYRFLARGGLCLWTALYFWLHNRFHQQSGPVCHLLDRVVHSVLEITFFFFPPILLNFFNVHYYGEVEFVLTVQVIVVVMGSVIAAGGGPAQLLGIDVNSYRPVTGNSTLQVAGNCTSGPGFQCLFLN